jgi:hypothetical protein
MDIHEYQAKEILASYGVKIAEGGLAYSPEDAVQRTREIGGNAWAVKAQTILLVLRFRSNRSGCVYDIIGHFFRSRVY